MKCPVQHGLDDAGFNVDAGAILTAKVRGEKICNRTYEAVKVGGSFGGSMRMQQRLGLFIVSVSPQLCSRKRGDLRQQCVALRR